MKLGFKVSKSMMRIHVKERDRDIARDREREEHNRKRMN